MGQTTINILIPVIGVILTVIGGFVTWYLNERSKRIYEEYKRKEDRYSELIRSLKGFSVHSRDTKLTQGFLDQVYLCWMYCPDGVIYKANKFLLMTHEDMGNTYSNADREKAVGELILCMREDLIDRKPLRKTKLKPEDFKYLRAK